MEPRKEVPKKAPQPCKEENNKRKFRIVKLEERIAPRIGGKGHTYNGRHCVPDSR